MQGKRVDIMHYHHAWNGFYKGSWADARQKYSRIMSSEAEVNFVTVLREPVSHYLSYYYYFIEPLNQVGTACLLPSVCFYTLFAPRLDVAR